MYWLWSILFVVIAVVAFLLGGLRVIDFQVAWLLALSALWLLLFSRIWAICSWLGWREAPVAGPIFKNLYEWQKALVNKYPISSPPAPGDVEPDPPPPFGGG